MLSIVNSIILFAIFIAAAAVLVRCLPFYSSSFAKLASKPGYYTELESLRGVLALSVFIHHGVVWYFVCRGKPWENPPSNFYSQLAVFPVTMFFFLTGFLFWQKLLKSPRLNGLQFITNRWWRLGPAYLLAVTLLFCLVAGLTAFRMHSSAPSLFKSAIAWLLFTFPGTPDLNGLAHTSALLVVTWTLRLEWLFYIMLPFLGFFAARWFGGIMMSAIFIGIYYVLLAVYRHVPHVTGFGAILVFMSHLAFTFSVGIVTACIMSRYDVRRSARSWPGTIISLLGLAVVLICVEPEYTPLESLLLAPLFLAIAGGNAFGVLRWRALFFLGQISYSVYLLHALVLAAVIIPLQRAGSIALSRPILYWALLGTIGLTTILLSTISHRWVEVPFYQAGRARSGSRRETVHSI